MCSAAECQRERHRLACARWRERNPDYEREDRLRRRVRREVKEAPRKPLERDPLGAIDWGAVRDVIGLEAAVVIEESSRVMRSWARDAIGAQVSGFA